MARVWVIDYPEAPEKKALYEDIAEQLSTQKSNLDNLLNFSLPNLSNLSTGGIQQGAYYDVYHNKTSEWVDEVVTMHGDLTDFSADLSTRIRNANKQAGIWENRIPRGHWEGTDD